MNPEQKRETLNALKQIKAGYRGGDYGICHELDYCTESVPTDDLTCFIEAVSKKWSKFSGSTAFPVPCPKGGDPVSAFFRSSDKSAMWKGKYGQLRLELLDFLIEELEKELAND